MTTAGRPPGPSLGDAQVPCPEDSAMVPGRLSGQEARTTPHLEEFWHGGSRESCLGPRDTSSGPQAETATRTWFGGALGAQERVPPGRERGRGRASCMMTPSEGWGRRASFPGSADDAGAS